MHPHDLVSPRFSDVPAGVHVFPHSHVHSQCVMPLSVTWLSRITAKRPNRHPANWSLFLGVDLLAML
jgi:hypothetical protein